MAARSEFGLSYESQGISILHAVPPSPPESPLFTFDSSSEFTYVDIMWGEPENNGAPIHQYDVFVRLEYQEDLGCLIDQNCEFECV